MIMEFRLATGGIWILLKYGVKIQNTLGQRKRKKRLLQAYNIRIARVEKEYDFVKALQ